MITNLHVSDKIVYNILKYHGMQRKYSPRDDLEHLERISELLLGEEWKTSEIPKKSKTSLKDRRYISCKMSGIRV